MQITNKSALDSLGPLVAACEDGIEAFQAAARDTQTPELRATLDNLAATREEVVADLRLMLRESGVEPPEAGTLSGLALRIYADFRKAVSSAKEQAILDELKRSEARIEGRFWTILEMGLPEPVLKRLHDAHNQVVLSRQALDTLEQKIGKAER